MKMNIAEPFRGNKIVKKSIDDILNETGLSSYRQILIQFNLIMFNLFAAYHLVLSFFTGSVPEWRCNGVNTSTFCRQHFNKTIRQSDAFFSERCHLSRSEWNYTTDITYSFVTEFGLDCQKAYLAAITSSSFYIGGITSAMVSGKISAMYGRKQPLIGFAIVCITTSIASSYVTNIRQLICLNLARGAGQVGAHYLLIIYQAELSPPKYRAILSTVLLMAGSITFFYLDILAYYVRTWRELSTYATLPCLPFLIGIVFLPKSPRWLYATGKKAEAQEILKTLSKSNECEVEILCRKDMGNPPRNYFDLVRNSKAFTLTSANLFIWLSLPILYYTIALQAGSFGDNMYVSFAISTAADIPACIILIFICDALGRKKTILGGMFICNINCSRHTGMYYHYLYM